MKLDPQSPYQLIQETPGGIVYKVFKSGSFRGYLSRGFKGWSTYDKNNNHLRTNKSYKEALEAF